MTDIPKIVRQRLAASAKPGGHPDPDLLTAFAEQALAERERTTVLAHLARCVECREVVMLAAPQLESVAQESPERSGWLGWPVLRWGALAACAVVVVAAVSLRERSQYMARIGTEDESPQVAMKQVAPSAEQKGAVAAGGDKDRVAMEAELVKPEEKATPQGPVARSSVPAAKTFRAAKVAAPAQTGKLALSQGALDSAVSAENKPAANTIASEVPAAPSPARDQMEASAGAAPAQAKVAANLGKAKQGLQAAYVGSLEQGSGVKREAMAPSASSMAQYAYKKVTPRWTLSADGTLQRSLDAGKTWKTIPVAADATLTAVAAMNADIWVGGSHGSLYHSTDAGENWTQVVPTSNGQPLTSNVIGIEFADTGHGKITTASQEIWTTADGGQTWQISR